MPSTYHPFSLASRMKLASRPGQGLCLSHARLDPRHFIALTLPPTVTAALNEATHMCSDQVGQEPSIRVNVVCRNSLHRNPGSAWIRQCLQAGTMVVTSVRITEHNGDSAAVMPAQGKQQEAVVVDSAVMKLALRQVVTLPL